MDEVIGSMIDHERNETAKLFAENAKLREDLEAVEQSLREMRDVKNGLIDDLQSNRCQMLTTIREREQSTKDELEAERGVWQERVHYLDSQVSGLKEIIGMRDNAIKDNLQAHHQYYNLLRTRLSEALSIDWAAETPIEEIIGHVAKMRAELTRVKGNVNETTIP